MPHLKRIAADVDVTEEDKRLKQENTTTAFKDSFSVGKFVVAPKSKRVVQKQRRPRLSLPNIRGENLVGFSFQGPTLGYFPSAGVPNSPRLRQDALDALEQSSPVIPLPSRAEEGLEQQELATDYPMAISPAEDIKSPSVSSRSLFFSLGQQCNPDDLTINSNKDILDVDVRALEATMGAMTL